MWKTSCLHSEIKSFTENSGTYKQQKNSIPWRQELPIRNRKCLTFTFLNGQLRINNNYFSLKHSNVSEIPDAIYFFIYLFVCVYYACAGECTPVGDGRSEKDMRHPGWSRSTYLDESKAWSPSVNLASQQTLDIPCLYPILQVLGWRHPRGHHWLFCMNACDPNPDAQVVRRVSCPYNQPSP